MISVGGNPAQLRQEGPSHHRARHFLLHPVQLRDQVPLQPQGARSGQQPRQVSLCGGVDHEALVLPSIGSCFPNP